MNPSFWIVSWMTLAAADADCKNVSVALGSEGMVFALGFAV